jgi:hypothetical protein
MALADIAIFFLQGFLRFEESERYGLNIEAFSLM